MAKRSKRAKKAIESLIKRIEEHFEKLEQDIKESKIDRGRYHYTEIDKSLLDALEDKLKITGGDLGLVEEFRGRLEKLREKMES